MTILVTGAAGFIGFHTSLRLLREGQKVVGIDNMNDYYDVTLKEARLAQLIKYKTFSFYKNDIAQEEFIKNLFEDEKIDKVIHLAAQPGVRYSFENPAAYGHSNLRGFLSIIEACRHQQVKHFVYASSSSVYGGNTEMPFCESHRVDKPLSLYAATKRSNELMAYTYAHLFGIPMTGLRFFTVYGPWGRPDMAMFRFTKAVIDGQTLSVYDNGEHERDFTYIDDIVEGILGVLDKPSTQTPPWQIFNIGNQQPVKLMDYIQCIEKAVGREAKKEFLPIQPGDVKSTFASVDALTKATGYQPKVSIQEGVQAFVDWYQTYEKTKVEVS